MPTRAQRSEAVRAHAEALRPIIEKIIDGGVTTLLAIAAELNSREIRAVEGGKWGAGQVNTLLRRLRFKT